MGLAKKVQLFLLGALTLADDQSAVVDNGMDMCASCPGLLNPCLNETFASMKFCDASFTLEERAADLVSRLTLEEKISYLSHYPPAISRLGLERYNWWSEGTHGISHVKFTGKTPWATSFALPITTSASFNRSLWHKTGAQISREARAFMNEGNAYSTYWTPVVNLAIDPRWGRTLETAGEDPYVASEYAVEFVQGFETSHEAPGYLQASAMCKHFVGHQLEEWNGTTRTSFDAILSKRDMLDSYLPPFEACVKRAAVSGLMCSYNRLNGVPSCANEWLLKDLARKDWKFNGYIVSDCDSVGSIFEGQHYGTSPEEAVAAALKAGTDMNCGEYYDKHVPQAIKQGLVDEAVIDERVLNTFLVRFRLGHFDETPMKQIQAEEVVCTNYSVELSLDGTRQGTILLKNVDKTLPWSTAGPVAVIGPNANTTKYVEYYGPSTPCFKKLWTMVDAVAQYAPVTFVQGLSSPASSDTSELPDAVAAAASAEKVVLVLGIDNTIAAEGFDQTSIELPRGQLDLLNAVAEAAKEPVVVVLMSGGAVDATPLLKHKKVGAILFAGQPSVTQLAVGDLIFGKVSPAGRMVQTMYPSSFVDSVSFFDIGLRPGRSDWPPFYNPGRTYRFYTGQPVIPFGFGLSYSSFMYEDPQPSSKLKVRAPSDAFSVKVKNTGPIEADDVVLGFLVAPNAGEDGVPLQTLFGFQRVHLLPGQEHIVTFYPGAEHFEQLSVDGVRSSNPGIYRVRWGVKETEEFGMGFLEQSFILAQV